MAGNDSNIRVLVTKFADRPFFLAYYDDPMTGRRISRSTKQTTQKAAEKFAAKWEAELQEGRYKPRSHITWQEFRETFLFDHLKAAKPKTFKSYLVAFNALERHLKVKKLAELTTARIKHLADKLRDDDKLSIVTVGTYLRHVAVALRWAHKQGMLNEVPTIEMPAGSRGKMKGRPITLEEFERMIAKLESVLVSAVLVYGYDRKKDKQPTAEQLAQAAAEAPAWIRFLWGLWHSGLRLGEAVNLTWDDDTAPMVDLSGRRPMLRIPADQQKGSRDTVTPITPPLFELLDATPKSERHGRVFDVRLRGKHVCIDVVSKLISAAGEAAKVIVDKGSGKFASAHDLRRSFGFRWAARVMPVVLRDMMRHADINTTMTFYVGQNAEAMADTIWAAGAQPAAAQPAKVAQS